MSVMRYFARHSMARLGVFAVSIVATFVVTPHMLACLGTAHYGIWALITSFAGYYMLLEFGVFQSVSKFAAAAEARLPLREEKISDRENAIPPALSATAPSAHPKKTGPSHEVSKLQRKDTEAEALAPSVAGEELDRIYTSACCLGWLSGLVTLLVGGALCLAVDAIADGNARPGAVMAALGLVSLSVAVQIALRASYGLLAARMRWTLLAVLTMIRTVCSAVAIFVFLHSDLSPEDNLLRTALITACGNLFEAVAAHVFAMRDSQARFRAASFSLRQVKELLLFGLPLLIMSGGDILRGRIQIVLVASTLNLSQTAMFSLARQFINYMDTVMGSVFGIMSPYFSRMQARGDEAGYRHSLLVSLQLSQTVAACLGLCLAFYGGAFVTRWLGAGFSDMQDLLVPLSLSCLAAVGQYPSFGLLIGMNRHSVLAALNVAEGVIVTAACVPVLILFGLPGLCWLFFVSAVVFRLGILPPIVSSAAGVPLWRYYLAIGGALFCQVAAQGLYFISIRPLVTPDYLILCLLGAGQFLVALGALLVCTRLIARLEVRRPALNNASPPSDNAQPVPDFDQTHPMRPKSPSARLPLSPSTAE